MTTTEIYEQRISRIGLLERLARHDSEGLEQLATLARSLARELAEKEIDHEHA